MNWGLAAAVLVVWVLLALLVRVQVVYCVRRRASDPAEFRDGQKHLSVMVWCPLIRRGVAVSAGRREGGNDETF